MVVVAPVAGDDVGSDVLRIGGKLSVLGLALDNDLGDGLRVCGIRTGSEASSGAFTEIPDPFPIGPSDPVLVQGKYGLLTILANGQWQYQLDAADPDTRSLPSGKSAVETFTYRVSDSGAATDMAEIRIEIAGTAIANTPSLSVTGRKIAGTPFGDLILPGLFGSTARADQIKGKRGCDIIDGGGGNDSIWGGAGNDILRGGDGRDWLKGGSGRDSFVFGGELGRGNVDTIADFKPRHDTLVLERHSFDGLTFGKLSKAAFHAGNGATEARDASDRIIYDRETGRLYFDEDGKGGADAIHFATLSTRPALTAADFFII